MGMGAALEGFTLEDMVLLNNGHGWVDLSKGLGRQAELCSFPKGQFICSAIFFAPLFPNNMPVLTVSAVHTLTKVWHLLTHGSGVGKDEHIDKTLGRRAFWSNFTFTSTVETPGWLSRLWHCPHGGYHCLLLSKLCGISSGPGTDLASIHPLLRLCLPALLH